MKVLSLFLVGLTPILLLLPGTWAVYLDNELFLSSHSKNQCQALSSLFSASFESPEDDDLRSSLVDHLRRCTVREGDLPVEYAPGIIASTGKVDPSMPVYPLYVTIKNNADDVTEALLRRGNLQMNITKDPAIYSENWSSNPGAGFLYFNPVWAAIDKQKYYLALRVIRSPEIHIYGYFKNHPESPLLISNPSFFIPHVISFFCNSEQAQKNENAKEFCMTLITEFPKNSFKLASCDGLPNHPSWAWRILQQGLLEFESIQNNSLVLPFDFPYAGKHSKPKSRYESNSCRTDCTCAVEVALNYAISQKDLNQKNKNFVVSWIKSLNDSPDYLELSRFLLRSLMEHKQYIEALYILQEQPQRSGSLISSYNAPKGFHKQWFENRSYDEVLLLDAFFYGNDKIIQHILKNSRFITPDFLKKLVQIGGSCGKFPLSCLFGSGLKVPNDNLLTIQTFINSSLR